MPTLAWLVVVLFASMFVGGGNLRVPSFFGVVAVVVEVDDVAICLLLLLALKLLLVFGISKFRLCVLKAFSALYFFLLNYNFPSINRFRIVYLMFRFQVARYG